jgi:hypothetical protein
MGYKLQAYYFLNNPFPQRKSLFLLSFVSVERHFRGIVTQAYDTALGELSPSWLADAALYFGRQSPRRAGPPITEEVRGGRGRDICCR